ncbi:methyltransferase domain-containing protein [Paenibacillus sp. LMG 31458]|uniref:Methyltransferase domain-containing protein n=1 Tax=Paenibacillus phytorum TaxID=2654977 RepID=A0ABX1Y1A5_9BACL|nr:class I SAM-dependent methyltransferase [Paenibacillus phytorum]NOU73891.1 methyltransferase domain-containing protein [Paenibacillus phytorum]
MTNNDLNSQDYWNERFVKDWDSKGGRNQTSYFVNLALKLIPSPILNVIQKKNLSVLDWGCAEGDGTVVLAKQLSSSNVFGLDFAEAAISKAKSHYSNITFFDGKLENYDNVYDVIFTSNCLEHYENPIDWMHYLSKWTKELLIILIPFQEYERIDEHFSTFDYLNIALSINNLQLLYHKVVPTEPSYWPGKQILLIYANKDSSIYDELTLDIFQPTEHEENLLEETVNKLTAEVEKRDNIISFISKENETNTEWISIAKEEVEKREISITFLKNEIEEKNKWIENITEEVRKRDESVSYLQAEIKAKDEWIKKLQEEVSKRDESVAILKQEIDSLMQIKQVEDQ